MASNPFDPKLSLGLLGKLSSSSSAEKDNALARALGLVPSNPALPVHPYSVGLGSLFASPPPPNSLSSLTGRAAIDLFSPPQQPNQLSSLGGGAASDLFQPFGTLAPGLSVKPLKAPVKRKAFFSFHYDDIMRVNVVRNAWKIDHPDNAQMRSFQDSSLWESRKLEGDDAVKRLIREGVEYTSAVCVLIGSETWLRRWVKYEIARAIIDGRGLLAVHLNSIRHHHTKTPHTRGYNPLDYMAVGKVQEGILSPPRYYLFEKVAVPILYGSGYEWRRYGDYTLPVKLPRWLDDSAAGYVTPLSRNAGVYDYIADSGHSNIGGWIDEAAQAAGR